MEDARVWAQEEFGSAKLGDLRRTRRLVQLSSEAAANPAGTITRACASSASREGAFRFLENPAIQVEAIRSSMKHRTQVRANAHERVIVPVDTTSLTLTDEAKNKGFGAVGTWAQGSRGIHVITAFALTEEGCPLGICAQQMWVRKRRSAMKPNRHSGQRGSETEFWLEILREANDGFAESARNSTAWYQLDRGGDCWPVFAQAQELGLMITVRAAYDRRLDGRIKRLWKAVERSGVRGNMKVHIPERPPRPRKRRINGRRIQYETPRRRARVAKLEIRAETVTLQCTTVKGHKLPIQINAVLAREVGRVQDRIEWMLLTTHSIKTRTDALRVVRAYTLRWRIEELHRTWKNGLCRVEDSQLRSREAVYKWATILVAVASRAMRLTHLARTEPDTPASQEMTRTELDALIALRAPKGVRLGYTPSLGEAVRWLADIGGYTGPWNGPPGPTVVGRGLHDVLVTARAFASQKKMR